MSFNLFKGTELDNILWQTFKVLPTVYEDALSYLEQVSKLTNHVNDDRTAINGVIEAVELFEQYVVQELADYDSRTIDEITTKLNGFIEDGTIANLINNVLLTQVNSDIATIKQEILDINYKVPQVELVGNPTKNIYHVSESINSVVLNVNITKGTNDLVKMEVYKNDVLLATLTNIVNGANTYVDGSVVNSDTSYYVKVYDDLTAITSTTSTYNFVNNFYYGKVNDGQNVDAAFILTLQNVVSLKNNLNVPFTCNNQKILYAYPSSYGDLEMIYNFEDEVIESFTQSTIVINEVEYKFYISNNNLFINNNTLRFAFENIENNINKNSVDSTLVAQVVENKDNIDLINEQLTENTQYLESGNKLYNSLHKMQEGTAVTGNAFGDSITWGQIPIVGGQAPVNYPASLQAKLRKIYANNNITIVNSGNPGQTTDFGLANIDTQVINQAPDFCIMMWGTNDCTARLDLGIFKDNLRQMVKKCLKANIEVLLLTCHSVFKSDDARANRQQLYAKAVIEVAKELDVVYINMFEEITNLVFNKIDTPISLLPDMVHFHQDKYYHIANIIINKALYINEFDKILEINKEVSVPIWHSPYIQTDIPASGEYDNTASIYGKVLGMTPDGTLGTYLRFTFFNKKQNQNLVLIGGKGLLGGQLTVLDNGVSVNTIDFYSSTSIQNVPNTVVENLKYGLHVIEILNTNIVQGQSSGTGKIYLSGFQIVENKNLGVDKYGGNTAFVYEPYTKLINGQTKFIDNDVSNNSQMLLSDKFVELKTGKTLEIEVEGTFFTGSGVSWFNNKTDPSVGTFVSGYMTMLYGGKLILYKSSGTAYSEINSVTTALDYSVPRTFKITHTSTGVITLYIDGTQILQYTDTTENSGYVGLYSGVSANGTMTIKRMEYCYI